MDEQYYRKPQSKPGFRERALRFMKKKNFLYSFLIVIPIISFVSFSNKGVLKRVSLEADKKAMIRKVAEAQLEQARLQDQSKALDKDPKAIEKVAREKFGMIRDGETVYKVRK